MSKNKLKKFHDLDLYPNVLQNFNFREPKLIAANGVTMDLKGNWSKSHFGNDHPIVLELACGMGHYSIALAQEYPEKNFIGVDIKGARLWNGATRAIEEGLENVAFLRTRIEQINHFFSENEVDEIWITFPDPFLKKSRANNRLTSAMFLERYRAIIKPTTIIHLKTDSYPLYIYTLEVLNTDARNEILYQNPDIYSGKLDFEALNIKTYYEKKHLEEGRKITYIQFRINS